MSEWTDADEDYLNRKKIYLEELKQTSVRVRTKSGESGKAGHSDTTKQRIIDTIKLIESLESNKSATVASAGVAAGSDSTAQGGSKRKEEKDLLKVEKDLLKEEKVEEDKVIL
jgi:hypothetical protein